MAGGAASSALGVQVAINPLARSRQRVFILFINPFVNLATTIGALAQAGKGWSYAPKKLHGVVINGDFFSNGNISFGIESNHFDIAIGITGMVNKRKGMVKKTILGDRFPFRIALGGKKPVAFAWFC
jgi:hypothetical protein